MDFMRRFAIELLEGRRLLAFPIGAGNDGFDYGTCSAKLADGSVIVGGVFSGTVSFDPDGGASGTLTSSGESDVFAAKYAANGDLVWVRQIGGPRGDFRIAQNLDDAVNVAINPGRAGGDIFVNGVGPDPKGAGEYVNSLVVGANDEVYLTGGFLGKADFDPAGGGLFLSSVDKNYFDIFVVKLDASGDVIWANKFGGKFTDLGNDIALDSAGNPYVTGVFSRDADFNPTSSVFNVTARGREDAFVMKLSVNGKLIWVNQLGSDRTDRDKIDGGNGIALDALGNIYYTGSFAGQCFFRLQPNGQFRFIVAADDETDAFTAKLDPDGNLVWMRPTGGKHFDGNVAIALLGSPTEPDVITGGYFERKITIGPGPGAGTLTAAPEQKGDTPFASDLLISRWDNNGVLIWGKQIGGGFFETIGRIAVDASSNIYIAGGFERTVDFDPGPAQFNLTSESLISPAKINDNNEQDGDRRSSYDNFFASLDVNGAFRFARSFGGDDDDLAIGLSRPQIGQPVSSFALTGRFARDANFDPGGSVILAARGRSDIWVSLYDTDGNLV